MTAWEIIERWVSEATIPSATCGSLVILFLELAGEWDVFCLPLRISDTPCPSPELCALTWPAYTVSKGSLAQLHLHPSGDGSRRLERGWQWDQVFLPLAPTLPVCSGHLDLSTWGGGSLGSPLLTVSCSGSRPHSLPLPFLSRGEHRLPTVAGLRVLHCLFP